MIYLINTDTKQHFKKEAVMKKILSSFLILCITVSFLTACGGKNDTTPSDENSIIGLWKTSVDMSFKFNDAFKTESPIDIELPTVTGFVFDITYEFKEDGSYTTILTKESGERAKQSVKPSLINAFETLYKALADQKGVTLEEFLDESEIEDFDQLVELLFADESFSDFMAGYETGGRYSIKGNKIYQVSFMDDEFSKYDYTVFTFEDGNLIFTEMVQSDPNADTSFKDFLPLVFEKQ